MDKENHRDNVITRSLTTFILSLILLVLGWVGFNVAESRVAIARLEVQIFSFNERMAPLEARVLRTEDNINIIKQEIAKRDKNL